MFPIRPQWSSGKIVGRTNSQRGFPVKAGHAKLSNKAFNRFGHAWYKQSHGRASGFDSFFIFFFIVSFSIVSIFLDDGIESDMTVFYHRWWPQLWLWLWLRLVAVIVAWLGTYLFAGAGDNTMQFSDVTR
ncbi:hypothetical protein F4777DRAFT_326452 [Nemania sp. FL0916]|nr:hypothetical protein F4777DRAFT_326452 [Nemania sp. FL0916]